MTNEQISMRITFPDAPWTFDKFKAQTLSLIQILNTTWNKCHTLHFYENAGEDCTDFLYSQSLSNIQESLEQAFNSVKGLEFGYNIDLEGIGTSLGINNFIQKRIKEVSIDISIREKNHLYHQVDKIKALLLSYIPLGISGKGNRINNIIQAATLKKYGLRESCNPYLVGGIGIPWFQVFIPRHYTEHCTKEQLLATPAYKVEELANDVITIQAYEKIGEYETPEALKYMEDMTVH